MAEAIEKVAALYGLTVVEFERASEAFEREVSPNIGRRDEPVARSWFMCGWKRHAESATAPAPVIELDKEHQDG